MDRRRFESLERQRNAGRPAPVNDSSVADRFGEVPREGPSTATTTDGKAPRMRTEESRFGPGAAPGGRLPVLDLDRGQYFVRCLQCRADSYPTAARCAQCGADLATREQRAFNESFWRERQGDEAELRVEVEELRRVQQEANREDALAQRRFDALIPELERRRALGLSLDDGGDVHNPLLAGARKLGLAIGTRLRRLVPDRRLRIGLLTASLVGFAALGWHFRMATWVVCVVLLGLGGLLRQLAPFWRRPEI
jgi:hypothetical protein